MNEIDKGNCLLLSNGFGVFDYNPKAIDEYIIRECSYRIRRVYLSIALSIYQQISHLSYATNFGCNLHNVQWNKTVNWLEHLNFI